MPNLKPSLKRIPVWKPYCGSHPQTWESHCHVLPICIAACRSKLHYCSVQARFEYHCLICPHLYLMEVEWNKQFEVDGLVCYDFRLPCLLTPWGHPGNSTYTAPTGVVTNIWCARWGALCSLSFAGMLSGQSLPWQLMTVPTRVVLSESLAASARGQDKPRSCRMQPRWHAVPPMDGELLQMAHLTRFMR